MRPVFRPLVLATLLGLATVAQAESPAATAASTAVAAAAAPAKQVAGVQRLNVGDLLVTALYDGRTFLPVSALKDISAEDATALLEARFVPLTENGVQTAVNAFLVEKDGKRILVDAGSAACFGPTLGNVVANLRDAGFDPASIDTVLLTHLHPDHVCGIATADGERVFSNADILVAREDADHWLSAEVMAAAPEAARPMFKLAQDAMKPYQDAGRVKLFDAGSEPLAGVQALATQGHTPGHTSYLFAAADSTPLLVWGDVLHSHAVQFARPDVAFEFDSDRPAAVAARRSLLARAADEKLWVGGAHLPFPGLGHVAREGEAYRWIPVEFAPLAGE